MTRRLAMALAVMMGACPAARPMSSTVAPAAVTADDAQVIAGLEGLRGAGVAALVARPPTPRVLRALGRIGGPTAQQQLRATLAGDPVANAALDAPVAALAALAVAATLTPPDPTGDLAGRQPDAALATRWLDLAWTRQAAQLPAVLGAVGRLGDATALPGLTRALRDGAPAARVSAAVALGRMARRAVPWSEAARAALRAHSHDAHAEVRWAATWALGRVPLDHVEGLDAIRATLRTQVDDDTAPVRAVALSGLARLTPGQSPSVHATMLTVALARLDDADWQVATEAMRLVVRHATGDDASARAARTAALAALAHHAAGLTERTPSAHVVLEGLRELRAHAHRPEVRSAIANLQVPASAPSLVRWWSACLGAAIIAGDPVTGGDPTAIWRCGGTEAPPHAHALRAELVATEVAEGRAPLTALAPLAADADPLVRAHALAATTVRWPHLPTDAKLAVLPAVRNALTASTAALAGAATELAGVALADLTLPNEIRADLGVALRATRATTEDPERVAGVLAAIAAATWTEGLPVCARELTATSATVRAAARTCIGALDATKPAPSVVDPPAHPAPSWPLAAPARVRWILDTTAGRIVIELDGLAAPVNVGHIMHLTRTGFYDGQGVHRVVPGFVVQGGDPTFSGWGGPGYAVIAEPATELDGPGFTRGAVGIADAGMDSGGSQWFITHAPTPHLDARYTWIGRVVEGQAVADALLIGDVVLLAQLAPADTARLPSVPEIARALSSR